MKNPLPLPETLLVVASPAPPPLEHEPPHKRLARLTKEHARITEELRTLRQEWKQTNLRAQATREPVPTTLITHVENQRRELHLQLERIQAEIGKLNKEVRAQKATVNGSPASPLRPGPKQMPYRDDPEFPTYFLLAAKDTLAPALYEQIVRTAKSLMHQARTMGVE